MNLFKSFSAAVASAILIGAISLTQVAEATIVFSDNFDSDTPPQYPSNWVNQSNPGSFTVVADGGAPSSPNSAQLDDSATDLGFIHWRPFTSTTLFQDSNLTTWGFSLNVDEASTDFDGAVIRIGNGSPGGGMTGGSIHALRFGNSGNSPAGTFDLFNDGLGNFIEENLLQDTWYDIELRITATSASGGTYGYYIDGVLGTGPAASGTWSIASGVINAIELQNVGQSPGSGYDGIDFRLDNHFLNDANVPVAAAVPEPSIALLAVLGGAIILRRRFARRS